ncbi:hypothetical protein PR048_008921 [Dryococelus australis]|uniref:Uncharacterized protein n=1 Tax=Dryococelus australis TaxID=614101 RepID=A0ABQ9HYH2_9NEOP|nr:hypothetical protein PR048_008921 [Dryococelus australis]
MWCGIVDNNRIGHVILNGVLSGVQYLQLLQNEKPELWEDIHWRHSKQCSTSLMWSHSLATKVSRLDHGLLCMGMGENGSLHNKASNKRRIARIIDASTRLKRNKKVMTTMLHTYTYSQLGYRPVANSLNSPSPNQFLFHSIPEFTNPSHKYQFLPHRPHKHGLPTPFCSPPHPLKLLSCFLFL